MPRLDLPEDCYCPITCELMKDPVLIEGGKTYEKAAITEWLSRKNTDPLSNSRLTDKTLHTNYLAKNILEKFKLGSKEEFLAAVQAGDVDKIRYKIYYPKEYLQDPVASDTFLNWLINLHHAALTTIVPERASPLHKATIKNYQKIIHHFLIENPDLNLLTRKNNQGNTALITACEKNDLEIIKILLKNKADPNAVNPQNHLNPFKIACHSNNIDMLRLLLSCANIRIPSFQDLCDTCVNVNIDILTLLSNCPPVMNKRDAEGSTLLHTLYRAGNTASIKALLNHPVYAADINVTDHSNMTIFSLACEKKEFDLISFLLSKNAVIFSFEALNNACKDNNIFNMAEFLLSINKDFNLELPDTSGLHWFDIALAEKNINMLKTLLENKSSITCLESLYKLCLENKINILDFLLNIYSDNNINIIINLKDHKNKNLLELAVLYEDTDLIRNLFQKRQTEAIEYLLDFQQTANKKNLVKETAFVIDTLIQENERDQKIQKEIIEPVLPELRENAAEAVKIAILLERYANPPLLSPGWLNNRDSGLKKLADEMANMLRKKEASWNIQDCQTYITECMKTYTTQTNQIKLNKFGTFTGLLAYIKNMQKNSSLGQAVQPPVNQASYF